MVTSPLWFSFTLPLSIGKLTFLTAEVRVRDCLRAVMKGNMIGCLRLYRRRVGATLFRSSGRKIHAGLIAQLEHKLQSTMHGTADSAQRRESIEDTTFSCKLGRQQHAKRRNVVVPWNGSGSLNDCTCPARRKPGRVISTTHLLSIYSTGALDRGTEPHRPSLIALYLGEKL